MSVEFLPGTYPRILALDLGTHLGWATYGKCEGVQAGTLELATPRQLVAAKKVRADRRRDIRIEKLAEFLWHGITPGLIVFEDVRFASSQAQAHLWASFRGVVWMYSHQKMTQIDCLDTGKLKLWTTGHGGATKDMMAASAATRWPQYMRPDMDDNSCDALCLLMWAREKIQS